MSSFTDAMAPDIYNILNDCKCRQGLIVAKEPGNEQNIA